MPEPNARAEISPESKTLSDSQSTAEQWFSDTRNGLIRFDSLTGLRLLRVTNTLIGTRLIVGFVRVRLGLVLGHDTSCGAGAVIVTGHALAIKSLEHLY
jgi:hypothetical protein